MPLLSVVTAILMSLKLVFFLCIYAQDITVVILCLCPVDTMIMHVFTRVLVLLDIGSNFSLGIT